MERNFCISAGLLVLLLVFLVLPQTSLATQTAQVNGPKIEQPLRPSTGVPQIPVTILGRNFGAPQAMENGYNYVRFGGFINTEITSWTGSEIHIKTPYLSEAVNDSSAPLNIVGIIPGVSFPLKLAVYTIGLIKYTLTQPPAITDRGLSVNVKVITAFAKDKESNPAVFTYIINPKGVLKDTVEDVAHAAYELSPAKEIYDNFIVEPPKNFSDFLNDIRKWGLDKASHFVKGSTELVVNQGILYEQNSAPSASSGLSAKKETIVAPSTAKSERNESLRSPASQNPQVSGKVVRIIADNLELLGLNGLNQVPLGEMVGATKEQENFNTAWPQVDAGSGKVYLKRGDIVKYIDERIAIANPLSSFPQSIDAVKIELPGGTQGWVVRKWMLAPSGSVEELAEVADTQTDFQNPMSPAPSFAAVGGDWSGSWTENSSSNSFNFHIDTIPDPRVFAGSGSETVNGQTQQFSVGGAIFGNQIFFYKYYPNRQIRYTGSVNGNSASGNWDYSFMSSGIWSMTKSN